MVSRAKIVTIFSILLAFQGLVAATATDVILGDQVIKSGDTVQVNITADQTTDNVYAILDNNSNGNYDSGSDLLVSGSVSSTGNSEKIGYFNGTNTSSIPEGNYTVYAVQQGSAPSNGETVSGQVNVWLEFDNTPPNITGFKVSELNFYSLNISFTSDEKLSKINTAFNTTSENLSITDFSKNTSSAPVKYWAVFRGMTEGLIEAELGVAADKAGNDGGSSQNDTGYLDPMITGFEFSSINTRVKLKIIASSNLTSINVSLEGDKKGYLDYSNFSESFSSDSSDYIYKANISSETDDYFKATLLNATNKSDTDGSWNQTTSKTFSFTPHIEKFYLNSSNQNVTLHIDANENLSAIDASYDGDVSSGDLSYSNFTESTNNGYYNYTVDIPSGQEGTYNATLNFVEDDSGNRNSTTQTDEIVVDSTAPTISEFAVSNPSTNQVVVSFNSSEELSTITATGSGIESFTLDENDFSTDESSAPYEYSASYNVSSEGDLTVTLDEAADASGNDGSSSNSLTVSVSYPPTIHEFDLFANSQDVDLEVNVSEQLDNLTVNLSKDVSGTLNMSNFTETSPNSYYIYTADISDGTEGEFGADLDLAEDTQGLDGSDGESDFLLLDNTPPPNPNTTTIVDSPITGSNEESVTVEVNFTSTTETGTLEVRFNNSNGNSVVKDKSVSNTDQLQSFGFNLSDLADGEIQAESRMIDEAGNVNNEGFTANSSTVSKDTTPPDVIDVITGDSLNGGSTARKVVTVELSDSPAGIAVSSIHDTDFTITANNQVRTVESISVDSGTVTVNLKEKLPTGAKPDVEVVDITDNFGNNKDTAQQVIARDGLSPQVVSAVIDNSQSTDSETFVEVNFSESLIVDSDSITLNGSTLTFNDGALNTNKHSVSYGELLNTGNNPKITSTTVSDDDGNAGAVENGEVVVNSFRQDITEGLNMVSFPIEDQSSPAVSELLPESKIKSVWAYYNGEWKIYTPSGSSNDFTQLKGGYGYIVNAKENFTIAPNVNTATSDNVADYPVEKGWNLVAQMQEYDQTADSGGAFSSTLNVEEVHKQTSRSLDYKRIDPDGVSPEKMKPGNAYWLKSGEGDTVITPNFAVSQSNIVIEFVRGIAGLFGGIISFIAGVVG